MRNRACLSTALTGFFFLAISISVKAQLSSPPTANCHVTDGTFTACPNGAKEWSDVQPLAFPATNSFLYVNQDSAHTYLYLMYDFPFRTASIAPTDSVHVAFDTVSQDSGVPGLEEYDIYIFGNGQMQVLEQGQPTPPGRIVGVSGFGVSPNSLTPHLMAELQVPLTPGPPTDYSPDPLFWSATVPPIPPQPPDPPSCPDDADCEKTPEQKAAWLNEARQDNLTANTILTQGQSACQAIDPQETLEAAQEAYDEALEALGTAAAAVGTAAKLADAPGVLNAVNDLLSSIQTQAPPSTIDALASAVQIAAVAVASPAVAAAVVNFTLALSLVAADAEALLQIAAGTEAVAYAACLAAVQELAAPYIARTQELLALVNDPPDPNFTVIATPTIASLPIITTATGLNSQTVNDFNALLANMEQQVALLQVIQISINRVSGAVVAGSAVWAKQQSQAVQAYTSQLIAFLQNESSLRAALVGDLKGRLSFTFSSADVSKGLVSLQNGLPAGLSALLTQLGLNGSTQSSALQQLLSTDPALLALLGTGSFPAALSDISFTASNNSAIKAFNALAAAPPSTSLTPSLTFTLQGDYVVGGVGLRGGVAPSFGPPPAAASIGISGIPSGAIVIRALLYWGMLDNGEDATLRNLTLNGNSITGARVGTGPDTCWGRTNSFTYRADVTPFVSGNGTYTLTNVAAGGNILRQGASLLVIYQLTGAPFKTIMVDDGDVSIGLGTTTGTTSFSGFTAAGPVSATTTFMVGDGQAQQFGTTPVTFTGSLGTLSLPGLFAANNGPLWDTDTFNVSSVIAAGSDSDSATIRLSGDCLLWAGQAFSVTSSPIAAAPITATAAVVQANANGVTAVSLRGLASTDAPTLQEQIQMIVQSRIIQNPALSASQLTTQLVNSLPPSVLPPAQAQSIITGVAGNLVPPPPVISGMPSTGCSLWPPNGKLVQVATVTASVASGALLPGSFKVTGTSSEPTNDANHPEIVISPNGAGGYVVQLQADRLGTGTGRIYTLTATATNIVGAVTTSTATCTVPHDQGQ